MIENYPRSAANLSYQTYFNTLKKLAPTTPPVCGPTALNAPLMSQAPLCFTSTNGQVPIGSLTPNLCGLTIKLTHPTDHQNTGVDYNLSPEASGLFIQLIRLTGPLTLQAEALNCSYPASPLYPWLSTPTPAHLKCPRVSQEGISPIVGAYLFSTLSVWSAEPTRQELSLCPPFVSPPLSLHI